VTAPGSNDRGSHLFASGDAGTSRLPQNISIDGDWTTAIDQGRVGIRLWGFLGGARATSSLAAVQVTFVDANRRPLGELRLPSVGPLERAGETGLFPVESNDLVPAGTMLLQVDLTFDNQQRSRDEPAYADNLELTLSEYPR
jgi:hypothetical protein